MASVVKPAGRSRRECRMAGGGAVIAGGRARARNVIRQSSGGPGNSPP